ncbi:MAG TPA: NnrU family protein [Casimicrobiaceae bacterium]|nr:NnrU family protein [Casimicrobiaceae bacterium]
MLIAGLLLFIGVHLVPTLPGLRNALVARLGDRGYRGVFTLISFAGLLLIIFGYPRFGGRDELVFAPVTAAIVLAPYVVTLALILFAAANMRGYLRYKLQHPMLIGLFLWSLTHLLANGSARASVLFGSFLAYSLVDFISAVRRHAVKPFTPKAKFDVMAIVGGVVVALVVMAVHRWLFGVPASSISL